MIGSGKYDFPGIRKAGAVAITAALATYSWGAWIVTGPLKKAYGLALEWCLGWLANKGLVVLNVGAIYVKGQFDQDAFDNAMEEGLKRVDKGGLTDAQKKAIDMEVINAFRKFGRISNPD